MKPLYCLFALSGLGCTTAAAPSPILDAVWCDVVAIPCVKISEPGTVLPESCSVPAPAAVPVTPPGGQRLCFDASHDAPAKACALLCDPNHRDPALFLNNADCAASVSTEARHGALSVDGYLADSCTGDGNTRKDFYLSGAGTSTVSLTGTLNVGYAGAKQRATVKSGQLNFWAPNTACGTQDTSCNVQLNQLELSLSDVALAGLSLSGWSLAQDGPLLTPSGSRFDPQPPELPNPTFTFPVPPGAVFDVIGNLQGASGGRPGFAVSTDREKSATVDLTTGEASIDLSVTTTLDGQPFSLSGTLTADGVVDLAPVIEPLEPLELTGDGATCSVDASLTAAVSSPVDLPLAVTFAVDDDPPALAGPSATGTIAGAGAHVVTVFATDALGAAARATQTVSVSCQ